MRDILTADDYIREADPALWEKLDRNRLRCFACGHCCPIPDGQPGVCKVRFNRGGKLYVPYGYVAGIQCDPIEKKPFFHAYPGALAYSFGMLGCALHCSSCQTWVTTKAVRDPNAVSPPLEAHPELLVQDALAQGAKVVVSTYNEPLITSEWAVAVFRQAREAGLKTAFVSNGNGTPQVLEFLQPWIDLYKVDLKSFDDSHYRELGGRLQPILDTIRSLHRMGIWLEIVTLLIPGFNDSDDELRNLTAFLASVSPDIPWHVTAFHQDYKMTSPADTRPEDLLCAAPAPRGPVPPFHQDYKIPSPADTRPEDLLRAAAIGREAGLRYIYAGNLPGHVDGLEDTRCNNCGELLIQRSGYSIERYKLTPDGDCPRCHTPLPGRWSKKFDGQIAASPFRPRSRPPLVKILSEP